MHWTGTLNLIALAFATTVVCFLWLMEGWHWYLAVLIGIVQGIGLRREKDRTIKKLLDGDEEIVEKLRRGESIR